MADANDTGGAEARSRASVETVRGPVAVSDLGFVLGHEHVFTNLIREYRGDGLMNEEALAAEELSRLAAAVEGPVTIMDCTTDDFGRDPEALARVSAASGVNILMGAGHYRDPYLDRERIDRLDVDALAAEIVGDLRDGVGSTGVRAGFIGEVGSDKWYVSASEERSFRAAARAQLETGAVIVTHAARWPVGRDQLKILRSEGVSPTRVVIGHCDFVPMPDYHLEMAEAGCFLGFEIVSGTSAYDLERIVQHLIQLSARGHGDKILLGHDVHLRSHLHALGGDGFDYIPISFTARLLAAGLSASEVRAFLQSNPQRALAADSLG